MAVHHVGTFALFAAIAESDQEQQPVSIECAATIASHWQSPRNEGLTALSTGHSAWRGMTEQIHAEAVSEYYTVRDVKPIGWRTQLEKSLQLAELCALLVFLDSLP